MVECCLQCGSLSPGALRSCSGWHFPRERKSFEKFRAAEMSWTERGLLSFIPVNTQGRGLGINPFSCFAPSSGSLLAASLFLSPARTSSFGIGTSEVIRMIKGGGQCYQPSWKIRSTACVGKAQDPERKLSRQWMAGLMVFDREVADLSWKRAEICAISHDRNMCFLVKGWRRFTAHWE